MKKITVTLTDEAEKVFNEIMYALPKEEDGSGMCNQSEAICHALEKMWAMEQAEESAYSGDVSNKCKCPEDHGWTTVMACNECGFICDPVWQEKSLTSEISEGEIDYLGKYKNDYPEATASEINAFEMCLKYISKGAKPISEGRINEVFAKHCGVDGYMLMKRSDFKAALKELNK